MTANAESVAADTSVAVPALDAGHAAHAACARVVRDRRPVLAGHAAFEVFSVLTRLPRELTVDPADAARIIDRVFPDVVWLSTGAADALRLRLAVVGISGGAVYDALVGEAARTHGLRLLTRDMRARRTYDLLGVEYDIVGL